jgi:hypothetical protein
LCELLGLFGLLLFCVQTYWHIGVGIDRDRHFGSWRVYRIEQEMNGSGVLREIGLGFCLAEECCSRSPCRVMEDCQRVLTEKYGMERFDVIDVCLSRTTESPALLCESPKSHESGPGRRHVIRASNLPKNTQKLLSTACRTTIYQGPH